MQALPFHPSQSLYTELKFLGLRPSNSMQGYIMFSCEVTIFHALLKLVPHSLACPTTPTFTITIKHAAKSIIYA